MGYSSVEQMDYDHDTLHEILCLYFNRPSYSLKVRDGLNLTHNEYSVANYEEDAVLYVQRWLQQCRKLIDEDTNS